MPTKKTLARARADGKAGKAASTQAGEFVREQIDSIRKGQHGARSAKQAIAIGLSEARRAGVDLPPPGSDKASASTRKHAARDFDRGRGARPARAVSAKRSRASKNALKREGTTAASPAALARQSQAAAAKRSPKERSAAARKAAATRKAAKKTTRSRRRDRSPATKHPVSP